jgi:exonuclease SbcD
MKCFHLSDLHLGKRVNGFTMTEDQTDILQKIVTLAEEHQPDAVLIAGDVYDKSLPAVEAVRLLDRFLIQLNKLGIAIFIISGNHDNAERLEFGAELFKNSHVHIVHAYDGHIRPVTLRDEWGDVNIWMLPYLKPAVVRRFFPDQDIDTYTDAVSAALGCGDCEPDLSARNIMIAHQFVTGAITSDSEEIISVGGSENIDAALFDGFDYVALGHIHRPQHMGSQSVRYSGSPLKYSFSEANHKKSVTVVDLREKGDLAISELPLSPLHDMREIRGTYAEIMSREHYQGTDTNDYIRVILTDEQDEPDAMAKLRTVYPNLMQLEYDNKRTRTAASFECAAATDKRTPVEMFGALFEAQNGQPMSEEQSAYVERLFTEISERGADA